MSEEVQVAAAPVATEPAIVDETSPPENDSDGAAVAVAPAADGAKKGGKGKKGKNNYIKREEKEQVPIEELFDLSKPIKRVERPSKDQNEAECNTIDEAIESLRTERKTLQSKIDLALGSSKNKNSPVGKERDALNKLKNRKGLMIEQKRQIRTRLEIIKSNQDRLVGQQKNTRNGMKFTNLVDIEKEIKQLQRKQETTSMSLGDEKKLIKEIEALQASRRTAEELHSKQGDLDSMKTDRKSIQADLAGKDKEIDTIQKQIDAQAKVVKELTDKQSAQRGAVDDLIKKREELKSQIDGKFKERTALRAQFRELTNEWYQCQRAIKAQQSLQYEEEKKRREEEHVEWKKKKEEEELAKTPYEEEMALCDYLSDYLTKAYLMDAAEEAEKKAKAAEEKAKADVVAVKDDPFAGMVARKRGGDEDEIYFGKGKKGKGGNKKGGSKGKKAKAPVSFSINLDLFDQFGMLSLNPPTSLDGVQVSVDELNAKKVWYSEQPRGSVPTARDIRKSKEGSAGKSNNGKSGQGGNNTRGKKGSNNFDIRNTSEFAPLGVSKVEASS